MRRRWFISRSVAALWSLVVVSGCGDPSTSTGSPPTPDVLLLTLDTTRADRLGCYGYEGGDTETFDRVAAEGLVFERAYCAVPITLPSHISILTGTYPCAHEVRNNGMFELRPEATTLAEVLRDEGYATGAFVTSYVVDRRFGLGQGFDAYPHPTKVTKSGLPLTEIRAELAVDRAIEWLRSVPTDQPVFLWLHLYDPHRPWEAPEPYATKFEDEYDAEIAYCDDQYARLLEAFAECRNEEELLQILTADHGESNGEHGEETHGAFVYDGPALVPLILRAPSDFHWEPTRYSQVVSNTAIGATVLELLGLPRARLSDSPLDPLVLRDGTIAVDDHPIYLESFYPFYVYRWSPIEAIIANDHKYIHTKNSEIYDLRSDPDEIRNLIGKDDLRKAMHAQLQEIKRRNPPLGWESSEFVDEETVANLEALGYAAGTLGEIRFDLPDAKDLILTRPQCDEIRALLEAARRAQAQNAADDAAAMWQRAEELLMQVTQADPEGYGPAELWGRMYLYQNKKSQAIPYLEKALLGSPRSPALHSMLGKCYRAIGKTEWADSEFRKTIALEPMFIEAYQELGQILASQGRFGEAVYLGDQLVDHFRREGVNSEFRPAALHALRKQMERAGQQPTPPSPASPESMLPEGVRHRSQDGAD